MKLCLIFLAFSICTSCAYLKNDAVIQRTEAENWKQVGDSLVYDCNDGVEVSLFLNQKLATKGSAYLLFGAIPIGKAQFSDRNFTLSVMYKPNSWICDRSDVSLSVDNKVIPVSRLWPQENIESAKRCIYSWSEDFLEHSEIDINFRNMDSCKISPIKVFYKTKLNYKYDAIAG